MALPVEWPRIAVALIATLLVAWFAVLAYDQHVGRSAVDRIVTDPGMSAADWDRAMGDLKRADLLDPSSDWNLTRANYLMLRDPDGARRAAQAIVRREPDNLGAWVVILQTSGNQDSALARQAAAEVRRLNPLPSASR